MSMVMTDMRDMTDTTPVEVWTFGGVDTLNGTQIPDAYFDEVMAPLGPSAFTVLMYVARRTFGFKRHSDQISLDQICHGIVTGEVRDATGAIIKPARRLDHGTGLAKSTVVRALDRLIAAGLIRKRKNADPRRGQLANTYGIVFKDPTALLPVSPASPASLPLSQRRTAPVSHGDTPCRTIVQAPVADVDTQQTVETTNSRRHTALSKRTPHVKRLNPPVDSTDSMVLTTDDTGTDTPAHSGTAPLSERIAHLSAEFGDDAPLASCTRVLNMQRAAGLSDDVLLPLLDEAAAIARSQAPTITKRGRRGTVIRMPYLLATLRGLVETTTDAPVAAPPAFSAQRMTLPTAPCVPDADDPPATTAAEVIWRAVLGEVRRDVTAANYAAWFTPTRALALEGSVLRIGVPTPFHGQWLEHKLRGCVDRALGHAGHAGVRIVYAVVPLTEGTTLPDRAPVADQVADQVTMPNPTIVPRPPVSPHEILAAAPTPRPPVASIVVSPGVVCPFCRAAPCRCRLTEQLRRVIAARAVLTQTGAPGP